MLDVAHEDHGDLGAGSAALGVEDRLRAAHRAADEAGCIGPRERILRPAGHAAGIREHREVSARADLSVFPDAGSVSGWAQDALAWANASGLISGAVRGTQTILNPQGSASRAQVAMILMGYVEHVVNA